MVGSTASPAALPTRPPAIAPTAAPTAVPTGPATVPAAAPAAAPPAAAPRPVPIGWEPGALVIGSRLASLSSWSLLFICLSPGKGGICRSFDRQQTGLSKAHAFSEKTVDRGKRPRVAQGSA